jgi:acyl-CoA synthetase (AMP-forming)/AMP-acid ligase II
MKNNIGLFITKRAQLTPKTEAVIDITTGQRQNYVQLNERCNRVANGLTDGGLAIGDRIATLLMNGSEFVETFFGAAKAGGVIVALNWRLVADELSFILTDSGANTMVFGTAFNEIVTELQSRGTDGTQVTKWIHVGDAADRPNFADGYEDILTRAPPATTTFFSSCTPPAPPGCRRVSCTRTSLRCGRSSPATLRPMCVMATATSSASRSSTWVRSTQC